MLNAKQVIAEINNLLQEISDGTGHWTNDNILTRLNMFHDELQLDVPELLIKVDQSLLSVAGTRLYTLPDSIGLPLSVKLGEKPLVKSSYAGMDSMSKSGQIESNWLSYNSDDAHYWYLENNKIGIYPTPMTANTVITVVGELNLTAMTDSVASYPFENIAYLKVAQRWLILKTASMFASEDGDDAKATTWDAMAEVLAGKLQNKLSIMRSVATDINFEQIAEGEEE